MVLHLDEEISELVYREFGQRVHIIHGVENPGKFGVNCIQPKQCLLSRLLLLVSFIEMRGNVSLELGHE